LQKLGACEVLEDCALTGAYRLTRWPAARAAVLVDGYHQLSVGRRSAPPAEIQTGASEWDVCSGHRQCPNLAMAMVLLPLGAHSTAGSGHAPGRGIVARRWRVRSSLREARCLIKSRRPCPGGCVAARARLLIELLRHG